MGNLLRTGIFHPKLLNNLLASSSLINIDFLLPQTALFDKSIILPLFVITSFGFSLSVFFYTLNKQIHK